MAELAGIFRLHGPQYLEKFEQRMPPSHTQALHDILECRTEALGGHVFECDECGELHYAYHSCQNRHCPECGSRDTAEWIERRREEILPVRYFHLVFTLPEELRQLVRSHQTALLNALCRAAADSLQKLADDPRHLGGRIGMLVVVHTWTRAMVYHPHVHCLVPGGALARDGSRWIDARRGFLVPVKALSPIFRAKFME
ncbi:IS91 family transposase, partial [Desulfoferrobacter suflitae]|uniref:IS91 family transposase n=1 Tax=Desulfoferrobacter suflitae TaxID=2865782 RepID=UPI00216431A0